MTFIDCLQFLFIAIIAGLYAYDKYSMYKLTKHLKQLSEGAIEDIIENAIPETKNK